MRPPAIILLLVSVLCLTAGQIEAQKSGWSINPNTQYHIQTDEGPERYFRFQTQNGQYRKEKRLADGTVIGTEGWLDPLGYLRIKDYIADNQGYRITRSKMVYVGKERPTQDAVSIAKKVPAQSGILVKPPRPPNPFRQPELKDFSGNSIEASTVTPLSVPEVPVRQYQPPTTTTESYPRTGLEDGYSQPNTNYLLPGYQFQSPYVSPYRTSHPYHIPAPVAPVAPSVNFQPPIYDEASGQASNALPVHLQIPSDAPYQYQSQPQHHDYRSQPQSQSRPLQHDYQSQSQYRSPQSDYQSAQTQSLHSDQRSPAIEAGNVNVTRSSQSQDGNPTYPVYDGTHTDANGFQYYLRTHYHEEEDQSQEAKKIGSFGYVDPFGIRRVVYYSADPTNGFIHKKNNKYVGHEGSPYDPQFPPSS